MHDTPVWDPRPAQRTHLTPYTAGQKLLQTLRVTQPPRPVPFLRRIVTEEVPVHRKPVPRLISTGIGEFDKGISPNMHHLFYLSDPLLKLEIFTREYGSIK